MANITTEMLAEALAVHSKKDGGDEKPKSAKKKIIEPQAVKGPVPRIVIPEGLAWRDAAKFCTRKADEEEEIVPFIRSFNTLPWAGAWALERVLEREYSATAVKASELEVPSALGVKKIRWGTWMVAGLGAVDQDMSWGDHGMIYKLAVRCPRMIGHLAQELLEDVAKELVKRELYAGTAVMLEPDDDGELFLNKPPKVVKLPHVSPADLILPEYLANAVEAELFTPIHNSAALKANGVPTRRGIMLAGRPGTGKTLAGRIAAKMAVDQKWTAFYLSDARGIEAALKIAESYSPAILICEDLDRYMSGDRTAKIDRVLNTLDGLDRSAEVIFVATTNDPSDLPAPLLRPGRFDSFLVFSTPDAGAAEQLLRLYLKDKCPDDMTGTGKACADLLPASIREVVNRALLHGIARGHAHPDAKDIIAAAMMVKGQQKILEEAEKPIVRIPAIRVITGEDDRESDRRQDIEKAVRAVAVLAEQQMRGKDSNGIDGIDGEVVVKFRKDSGAEDGDDLDDEDDD